MPVLGEKLKVLKASPPAAAAVAECRQQKEGTFRECRTREDTAATAIFAAAVLAAAVCPGHTGNGTNQRSHKANSHRKHIGRRGENRGMGTQVEVLVVLVLLLLLLQLQNPNCSEKQATIEQKTNCADCNSVQSIT